METPPIYPNLEKQLLVDCSPSKIKEVLAVTADLSELEKEQALAYFMKRFHDQQQKLGFKLVGYGAAILISSFLITVILFHFNYDVHLFMYISSVVGLSIAFWGVTKIL